MFAHLRTPHDHNAQRYSHLTTAYYDEVSTDNEEEEKQSNRGTKSVDTRVEKCDVCQLDTSGLPSFKYHHYYPWHQNSTIPCTECNATFSRKFQLAAHVQIIHGRSMVIQCVKCNHEHEYYRLGENGRIYAFHYRSKRKIERSYEDKTPKTILQRNSKVQAVTMTDEQRLELAQFAKQCNS